MEKILIIDGNDAQSHLYETELKREGYEVASICNGYIALSEVKTFMPDVVVMDIVIPDMDGIELLDKLITFNRKLPIIIHTSSEEFKDNFMTWCADAYIIKSTDFLELKGKIRQLLSKTENIYV